MVNRIDEDGRAEVDVSACELMDAQERWVARASRPGGVFDVASSYVLAGVDWEQVRLRQVTEGCGCYAVVVRGRDEDVDRLRGALIMMSELLAVLAVHDGFGRADVRGLEVRALLRYRQRSAARSDQRPSCSST